MSDIERTAAPGVTPQLLHAQGEQWVTLHDYELLMKERDEARLLCDDIMDELDPRWKDYDKEYRRACDIRRRWLGEGWVRGGK